MKKKEQEATPRAEKVENEFNALPAQDYPLDLTFRMLKTVVSMDDIEDVEQTQLRECESENVFRELKRLYTAEMEACSTERLHGGKVPLLRLIRKPGTKSKFWIIDGHHRYKAAKKAGAKEIAVEVADPKLFKVKNLDELHFLQARENATTQANRSTHDKFAAAEAVLKHHHHWTNNQIAKYCTISSAIVEAQRKRMEATGAIPKHEKPQAKAAAAVDNPENAKKSNRALAKELGVGEATVRRARQDSTKKNDAADPACLKCGKTLPPKRRKGLSYTNEDGEKVKFCCRGCVQRYAEENDLILDEQKHVLTYRPGRPYRCRCCDLPLKSGGYLTYWIDAQTSVQFCSESCVKQYAEAQGLKIDKKYHYLWNKNTEPGTEDVHATPEEEVQDADSAALDKVSTRAQHWVESHKPKCFHGYDTVAELDERKAKNTKGWTAEQLAEFEEGVQAYEKSDRNKPFPKMSEWSDEKLEGFIYAQERERISEREEKQNGEQQQDADPSELPHLETGDGVEISPNAGDQYIRTPVPIYRAFEEFFRRQRKLTPEQKESYEAGRELWRKEGIEADLEEVSDVETIGYYDEMEIQSALRQYGANVAIWKKEPGYRRKPKGVGEVIYQNDWAFIDEIKRILEKVEPGIWISREDLTKGHIFSLVDYIYNLLGCQASLFSDLFAEKVKSKKNGSGNA